MDRREDSDVSPARNGRKRVDSDESPPRRRVDSDESPMRRTRVDSDESPPRRTRVDSDESPVRRNRVDSDESPPRRRRADSDESPPRRRRVDSDESPSRRVRDDPSPPRYGQKQKMMDGTKAGLNTKEEFRAQKPKIGKNSNMAQIIEDAKNAETVYRDKG